MWQGFCCSCDATTNARRQAKVASQKFSQSRAADSPHLIPKQTRCAKNYNPPPYVDKRQCPTYQINPGANIKRYNRNRPTRNKYIKPYANEMHIFNRMGNQNIPGQLYYRYQPSSNGNHPENGYSLPHLLNNFMVNNHHLRKRRFSNFKHLPNSIKRRRIRQLIRRLLRRRRQVHSDGIQARGGQNCADRTTPPFVDPEKFHESTHCLRFSDLW